MFGRHISRSFRLPLVLINLTILAQIAALILSNFAKSCQRIRSLKSPTSHYYSPNFRVPNSLIVINRLIHLFIHLVIALVLIFLPQHLFHLLNPNPRIRLILTLKLF